MRMKEGENILKHLNVFNELLNQLQTVGAKVKKEDKTMLLLTSLSFSMVKIEKVTSSLLSNQLLKNPPSEGELLSLVADERGMSLEKDQERHNLDRCQKKDGHVII